MNSSQGSLEALAALCGTQSDAQMDARKRENCEGGSNASNVNANSSWTSLQGSQEAALTTSQQSPSQQSPIQGLTPQQWQHALAAAAALQQSQSQPANGVNTVLAQSLLLPGLSTQGLGNATMEQLALHRYLQQAKVSAAQQAVLAQSLGGYADPNHALVLALAGKAQQLNWHGNGTGLDSNIGKQSQQVMPPSTVPSAKVSGSPLVSTLKPAAAPLSSQNSLNTLGSATILNQASPRAHQKIAPMPGTTISSDETSLANVGTDDKKQYKRAANRKSAQLSRKRKKAYIEELKDENDELRRKELILRSIPDLIVVFDSSGKLGFVSESFSKFLDIPSENLEGTSFWDRICHDSVRLLKAAFMDALAAREPHADTAALGSGVWELRLLDKNSMYMVVTLNGVVHFTGESPECVCCIRPSGKVSEQNIRKERKVKSLKPPGRPVSSSDGSRSSDDSTNDEQTLLCVNPNQSVMGSDTNSSSPRDEVEVPRNKRRNIGEHEISESSGSEDGIASS